MPIFSKRKSTEGSFAESEMRNAASFVRNRIELIYILHAKNVVEITQLLALKKYIAAVSDNFLDKNTVFT